MKAEASWRYDTLGRDSLGTAMILSAVILGAAVVGSSLVVKSSLDRGTRELEGVHTAVGAIAKAVPTPAPSAPTPAATRRSRPDPNKRYQIALGKSPVEGPSNAPVTIIEFSDFQCPFCRRVRPTLEQIRKQYGDKVRIAFKHLPLSIHPKAPAAHAAAEAAHHQGKFWEMHDKIFGDQREMSPEKYAEYAQAMGLDMKQFERDVASAEVKQQVAADSRIAANLGVTGTPSFFVNGRYLSGAQPFSAFKRIIDEELSAN